MGAKFVAFEKPQVVPGAPHDDGMLTTGGDAVRTWGFIDGHRLAACYNACEGLADPEKDLAELVTVLDELIERCKAADDYCYGKISASFVHDALAKALAMFAKVKSP
jgi:hypothetical protein